jgi:DNA polymerase III alpha subunit
MLPMIRRLVGRPRHIAVHPGGIVIDWRPLDQLLPLELAPKGVVITQYDLVAVAKLGLVKIDLLGNRCLSEIEETLALAGSKTPLRLESIPPEDPATLELIDRADTIGCFQLESPAMRSLLARLPIRRQSDLIAALALIRPGAAAGEVKNTFIRLARREEQGAIPFPLLADRLRETHGLLIYEEDIMVLLARSGGISLAESDEYRRGIVKSGGDPATLVALQARFLTNAESTFPNDRGALARARRAWSVAARFAAYSFNKAHAASYALLAYCSAYLKVHHAVELGCALLNHHQGLYPLRTEAAELLRMGVKLLSPHVNESEYRSRVVVGAAGEKGVRAGLDKIRHLSRRAALGIIEERERNGPFPSLALLLQRVKLAIHEVDALVLSGACDGLLPLDGAAYPFVHEAAVERLRQKCDPAALDGMRLVSPQSATVEDEKRMRLYQALVRVRNELTYLEMHIFAHPMALLREEALLHGCLPIEEAIRSPADSTVSIAAIIAAMRRVVTRQGPMQFITFEDETGVLEAVVFPVVYRRLGERVTTPGPFLVVGKMKEQQGAVHLEVGRLEPFHERKS